MLLSLTFLYIDNNAEDAARFRMRLMSFPALDGFSLEFVHKRSVDEGLRWIGTHQGSDLIVCVDPSSPGIGSKNVNKVISLLKERAETDRVFAIPSSATNDELWSSVKKLLPKDQILSKRDVYHNGGMAILAKAAIESMASRNSDGRRQLAIEMAKLDGDSKLRDAEIIAQIKMMATQMDSISRDMAILLDRMGTLDKTIYMSHPGSQVPPMVEQVRSNQQGISALMRDVEALDRDINGAVTLMNSRMNEMQERLVAMIDSTRRIVDEIKERLATSSTQIRVNREQFVMKVALAFVGLLLAGIAAMYGIPIAEIIGNLLN